MNDTTNFEKKYKGSDQIIALRESEVLEFLKDDYINPRLVVENMFDNPGEWIATTFSLYRYVGHMPINADGESEI
jgi:hypothetical protein